MSLILTLYDIQNIIINNNMNIMFKKESILTAVIIVSLVGVTNLITYYLCTEPNKNEDSIDDNSIVNTKNIEDNNEIDKHDAIIEQQEQENQIRDSKIERMEKLLDKKKELTEMLDYLERIQESLDIIKSKLHKDT